MKRFFQVILSLSLIYMIGCEGAEGPMGLAGSDGTDGEDGVANIHTEIIEMTTNNTEYIANPGYLKYTLTSNLITQAVIDSGLVVVEFSPSNNPYIWNSLPFISYDGDNSALNWMITCIYMPMHLEKLEFRGGHQNILRKVNGWR